MKICNDTIPADNQEDDKMRKKQKKEITPVPQLLSQDGTIRVCDVKKYYGTDNNVTKAIDRAGFPVLFLAWEAMVC